MEKLVKTIITIFFVLIIVSCSKVKKEFYANGKIKSEIEVNNNGVYNGLAKFYYENGELEKEVIYDNGSITYCKVYYKSGKLKWEVPYYNNIQNGRYIEYYENGEIKKKVQIRLDTTLNLVEYDSLNNLVFEYVRIHPDSIPEFRPEFIELISKEFIDGDYDLIKLNIPGIPPAQLEPSIINGQARVKDRIKGLWEIKPLNFSDSIRIGIRIIIENDEKVRLGYKTLLPPTERRLAK